jgi:hypothetical protein
LGPDVTEGAELYGYPPSAKSFSKQKKQISRRHGMQFIDLAAQQRRIRKDIESAMAGVLDHGRYIMGPEIPELEQKLALCWCA